MNNLDAFMLDSHVYKLMLTVRADALNTFKPNTLLSKCEYVYELSLSCVP